MERRGDIDTIVRKDNWHPHGSLLLMFVFHPSLFTFYVSKFMFLEFGMRLTLFNPFPGSPVLKINYLSSFFKPYS